MGGPSGGGNCGAMKAALLLFFAAASSASRPVLFGYDMVAYKSAATGVIGSPDYASELRTNVGGKGNPAKYANYTFYFSSEANKQAFDKDPWSFAPVYGGF